MRAGPDRSIYDFAVQAPGEAINVIFHLRHDRPGLRTARLGVGDGPPVEFRQIVYP